jgi:hypothetical protein
MNPHMLLLPYCSTEPAPLFALPSHAAAAAPVALATAASIAPFCAAAARCAAAPHAHHGI